MANESNPPFKRFEGMWPIAIFGITILINLGVAVSTLWVKSGYTSKAEFEAFRAEQLQKREATIASLQNIAVDLGKINVKLGDNDRQDRQIENLENRMRIQEGKR